MMHNVMCLREHTTANSSRLRGLLMEPSTPSPPSHSLTLHILSVLRNVCILFSLSPLLLSPIPLLTILICILHITPRKLFQHSISHPLYITISHTNFLNHSSPVQWRNLFLWGSEQRSPNGVVNKVQTNQFGEQTPSHTLERCTMFAAYFTLYDHPLLWPPACSSHAFLHFCCGEWSPNSLVWWTKSSLWDGEKIHSITWTEIFNSD